MRTVLSVCLRFSFCLVFVGCAGTAGRGPLPSASEDQILYTAARHLAYEQQRSAALERELVHRNSEVQHLGKEVRDLRARNTELSDALDLILAGRGELMLPAGSGPPPDAVARALRSELGRERERREAAEDQLARLRAETSTSPYAGGAPAAAEDDRSPAEIADLRAAKEDIADLQLALEAQRLERERLAADLRALESAAAGRTDSRKETQVLRAQMARLRQEQQDAIAGFSRYYAESQQRTAELEQQLEESRAQAAELARTGGGGSDTAAVRTENDELRARLEEERIRTEELAEKLEMARRVTDLIFKMQGQQAAPQEP